MSARIDILPGSLEELYKYEVRITEDGLQCLDDSVILEQFGLAKNLVKIYLDRKLDIDSSTILLEKLERIAGENGSINIFTTGRNFNDLMKIIGTRSGSNHIEMHIDDNDIRDIIDARSIICSLNFSRISCDCYFSDRYLMNFNAGDFMALCRIPECKFDREMAFRMRSIIEAVWGRLVPSFYYGETLSSFEKTEMVLDYIRKNIIFDDNSMNDVIETFNTGVGSNSSLVLFANLLLDNYLAQVDCRVVDGTYLPTGDLQSWIVTKHNGNYYGHCLIKDYRFTDLASKGYAEGIITLDREQNYRDDFRWDVNSYLGLDEVNYFSFKAYLDMKRSGFVFPSSLDSFQLHVASSFNGEYDKERHGDKIPSLATLLNQESHHKLTRRENFSSVPFTKRKVLCRNTPSHIFNKNKK